MMDTMLSLPISFEFFPPKTQEGLRELSQVARELGLFSPEFFSVTYGAGGSTREGTLESVSMLQDQHQFMVAPHLSCMGSTKIDIMQTLSDYHAMGVRRIVALRGDLPSGMGQAGEFKYASELVALIRELSGDYFHIEVAAYPEIHPQAQNALDDVMNLKRKFERGANSAITQYFFNPDAYFYYLDECAKQGIHMPIIPGIMPITQFSKLVRFSDMCGAEIPRWIKRRLESYGDDMVSIREFGQEVVSKLCQSLIIGGAPGLHFYTLNKAEASIGILKSLGYQAATKKDKMIID